METRGRRAEPVRREQEQRRGSEGRARSLPSCSPAARVQRGGRPVAGTCPAAPSLPLWRLRAAGSPLTQHLFAEGAWGGGVALPSAGGPVRPRGRRPGEAGHEVGMLGSRRNPWASWLWLRLLEERVGLDRAEQSPSQERNLRRVAQKTGPWFSLRSSPPLTRFPRPVPLAPSCYRTLFLCFPLFGKKTTFFRLNEYFHISCRQIQYFYYFKL